MGQVRKVLGGILVGLAVTAGAVGFSPTPLAGAQAPNEVYADFHNQKTPPLAENQFELMTLSTLPDMVTNGDVLMAVRGLAPEDELKVLAGNVDVTSAFAVLDGGERRGLVIGLPVGQTVVSARSGDRVAKLTVKNHPISGPVISGPHQTPFACRTEDNGLGPAQGGEDCWAPPGYSWYYRSSEDQGFHQLSDPYAPYPSNVQVTQTSSGAAVPFVVRIETQVINRGIARIAVLDDPAARGPAAPFAPTSWDKRIYYAFGESCGVGYNQGRSAPEIVLGALNLTQIDADNLLINLVGITDRLSRGDVIVHSTLTSYGNHCNPIISIETASMIKEFISDTYGLVEAVVGTNGSGAALQQYNAINNAPGLIDAAMPTATFADIATTAMTVGDCGLLESYFGSTSLAWSDEEIAAVTGHNIQTQTIYPICQSWGETFLDRIDPTRGCSVPSELRYNPDTNPTGARCTIQDANVNLFGKDPATGFAYRPLDNVGVQYGLVALQTGTITLEQFIDLNSKVGGYDIDGQHQTARHEMSSEVASRVYQIGGILGRGALEETPVMDLAPYLDLVPVANIHESVRPFVVRDRLRKQTGQDETQSIWRGVLTQADAYPIMEKWLNAILAAQPEYGGSHMQSVIDSKPAEAEDRCSIGTVGGRLDFPRGVTLPAGLLTQPLLPGLGLPGVPVDLHVDVPEDFDSGLGPCSLLLPVVRDPRIAAGGPLSDDVIKCQRRPVNAADYSGASAADITALQAIFTTGVCDFTKPAAEDVQNSMIWVSVGDDTLTEPTELHWRVARSFVEPLSANPATPLNPSGPGAGSGNGGTPATPTPVNVTTSLPRTGGGAATLGLGLAGLALVLVRRRGDSRD